MASNNDLLNALKGGIKREEPQPTAAAPQPTAAAPQPTAAAPQPTAAAPQPTAAAPQPTTAAPQPTATAPQPTAAAPQSTAAAPGSPVKPGGTVPSGNYVPGDTVKVGGKSYTVEKLIGSGSEGDIYIVADKRGRYALKLCHHGFKTNVKVLQALEKLKGKGYIAEPLAYDESFELAEYLPEGSAAQAGIKGNAQAILAIALKTAMTLDAMHKAGVLHKDVKPANILIENRNNWNSVLCDFGIADLLDKNGTCATKQVRTPIYAAPEVYTDTITLPDGIYIELSTKADFYSLGMTILSLWMGEGEFKALEQNMAIDKVKGRIAVPADMPDPLARICRGLLIKDPAKRWNLDEILRTMDGEDVPVDEALRIEDLNITYNASKHQVANTPEELAAFMADDVDLAVKYLYRGQIERWVKPYSELAIEIHDIVEKRYPKDQNLGTWAAIYHLDPAYSFPLSGFSRETGEPVSSRAVTLKDVGNFFNAAVADASTAKLVGGEIFKEWVHVRSKDVAARLALSGETADVFMLRVQQVDPLSDINLINDTSDPDYAMTGEGLGRLLNKVYHIFWNICGGDVGKVASIWGDKSNAPENRRIPVSTVVAIAVNFLEPEDYHYVTESFDTKGNRFEKQRQWFVYCTDRNSDDYTKKAGPKDDLFRTQAAWMKVIKGFGATPEYTCLDSGETYTDLDGIFSEDRDTLKTEYDERGLRGFLAVHHQEDPDADLSEQFAYEDLLYDYLEDLRDIDPEISCVERFDEAQDEADRILSDGKGKVTGLSVRSILQRVGTILFAFIPMLILFTMLVFSIIDTPVVEVGKVNMGGWVWILGLVIGAVVWLWLDISGCIIPLIIGVVSAGLMELLVKFLGAYVVWFFAIVVLAALVFLSIKTVFNTSSYAKMARKFTKPGFDEQVLEPLYYAFSDETSFDSSLNGAFNDDEINNWRDDLRRRRIFMWIFIGTAWVLILFSLMVPKSPRFEKFTAPVTDKIENVFSSKKPKLIQAYSLKQGDHGEDVKALQRFLKAAGYTKNNPDGDYGPGTAKAVSAFQLKAGLDITGEADHKTIKAVNRTETARALAAGETPPPAPKEAAPAPKAAAPAPAKPAAPKTTAPASTPAPAKTAEPSKSSEGGITLEQLKAAAAAAKKNNE